MTKKRVIKDFAGLDIEDTQDGWEKIGIEVGLYVKENDMDLLAYTNVEVHGSNIELTEANFQLPKPLRDKVIWEPPTDSPVKRWKHLCNGMYDGITEGEHCKECKAAFVPVILSEDTPSLCLVMRGNPTVRRAHAHWRRQ